MADAEELHVSAEATPSKKSPVSQKQKNLNGASPNSKNHSSPKEFIISVAANIASQPLQNYDPDVWGVLTAISNNARKRQQGINIILRRDEHCFGRLVSDPSFQIESNAVSGNHCRMCRAAADDEDNVSDHHFSAILKDTSTNGTYLNWEKLKKCGPQLRVKHGDIISLAAPPQHEAAFAYVYREVIGSPPRAKDEKRKRKSENFVPESKKLKGIGIGAREGPISLDDFKSLQRSNTELRKQLESQVLMVDTLRSESRSIAERHENEIKEVKESVTKSLLDELNELRSQLDDKQKELAEVNKLSAEQKGAIHDLNERLCVSTQSVDEANEVIKSQKLSIAELKAQLDDERDQRREEQEKAAAELKAAVQKCQAEAEVQLNRFSDTVLKREREQLEVINKLKESEKETSLQLESLLLKLEDTRQKLVYSDNRIRKLEAQFSEEKLSAANGRKKVEELEYEIKRLQKELENEKAAREEAWTRVSALELEINAAMRDLDFERQRLRGARERIMVRETQLRSFYSTTEEISLLFAKQQEQLKAMQRTLEDEENNENASADIDLNVPSCNANEAIFRLKEKIVCHANSNIKASSSTSAQRFERNGTPTLSEAGGVTEKQDCDIMSQEGQNTQEAEYTSTEQVAKGGFGSEIEGIGTVPILEVDPIGTECVFETESPGIDTNVNLNMPNALGGDTMQIDDERNVHESGGHIKPVALGLSHQLQVNDPPVHDQKDIGDTEGEGGDIGTADLLASEVAGSWVCSTAPSVHGENDTQRSREERENETQRNKELTELYDSIGLVAESQTRPSTEVVVTRRNHDQRASGEMIGTAAIAVDASFDQGREKQGYASDSDTRGCSDTNDDGGGSSDAETEVSSQKNVVAMDEDDEGTQQDSVG